MGFLKMTAKEKKFCIQWWRNLAIQYENDENHLSDLICDQIRYSEATSRQKQLLKIQQLAMLPNSYDPDEPWWHYCGDGCSRYVSDYDYGSTDISDCGWGNRIIACNLIAELIKNDDIENIIENNIKVQISVRRTDELNKHDQKLSWTYINHTQTVSLKEFIEKNITLNLPNSFVFECSTLDLEYHFEVV